MGESFSFEWHGVRMHNFWLKTKCQITRTQNTTADGAYFYNVCENVAYFNLSMNS